jgi:predicted nucleotidyltransferase component of viral defense system
MPYYDKGQLGQIARENGFVRDTFEKVLRLKEVLFFLNKDEYLKEHLALKGGTAINLTIFDLPRLSIDLDMDFVPNLPIDEMKDARARITALLKAYMSEEGYSLSDSSRYSHSQDSFLFNYQNAGGNRDSLKVEVNYSLRSHIFSPAKRAVVPNLFADGTAILTLVPMEIFAAKTNALLSRAAARDLYDFSNIIPCRLFDETEYDMVRKSIVFYAAISSDEINKTFETSAIDKLNFSIIRRDLFPVLRQKDNFNVEERKRDAKDFISRLMVLTSGEKAFLELFETGEYKPELVFQDEDILNNIANHPMARWKLTRQ